MMKTLKCQVKPFKVCSDGWKEFLPIREHFIYYVCMYVYIYIYIYICNAYCGLQGVIDSSLCSTRADAQHNAIQHKHISLICQNAM